jgi:putative amide transporter protein
MLLAVVLLYVGAVLVVNGIWLVGQARAAESPGGALLLDNREVAVMNIFTGFVGVAAAVTIGVKGNTDGDIAAVRSAGFILLFAFTYLWVAFNQFLNVSGHAFGWYCLFVSITAVPAGIFTLADADGNAASIYLGLAWFAWAILWFLFWMLLALERPIGRITGWVTILEGIATAWVFGFLLLEDVIAF